jgi:hypothetical protein
MQTETTVLKPKRGGAQPGAGRPIGYKSPAGEKYAQI